MAPFLLPALAAPAGDLAAGEAAFLEGNALCDARRYAEALPHYDRAIAFGYEDHVIWNNKGVALDSLGRHEEAVDAYEEALRRRPMYEIAWYNLGNAYAYLGRLDRALDAYDRALEIRPGYPEALTDKALAPARLGRQAQGRAPRQVLPGHPGRRGDDHEGRDHRP